MKKRDLVPPLLTALLFSALMAMLLLRSLFPALILPKLKLTAMALISLLALLIARLIRRENEALSPGAVLLAAGSFSLLPLTAGYIGAAELWSCALGGGAMFFVCHALWNSACLRLPKEKKSADIVCALLILLALQGFSGMFL